MRKLPNLLTKSDRRGLIFIIIVAAILMTGAYFLGRMDTPAESMKADSLSMQDAAKAHDFIPPKAYNYGPGGTTVELFPFDPNTADSTELLRLGLKPYQVRMLYHYRAAGGEFRKPEDFARLHGLTMKQYQMLRPYIVIRDDYRMAADVVKPQEDHPQRDTTLYSRKLHTGEKVEINGADTTQLRKIPGIGAYFARAIVKYREHLGGYYSASQLKDIEGFPEEALPYISVDSHAIHRLLINRLTFGQLLRHPYINYSQAKEISNYRKVSGYIRNAATMRMFGSFTSGELDRLLPYIDFTAPKWE